MYTRLDSSRQQIRLLTVRPAAEMSEQICCTLHTVSLFEKPTYCALSYTWGDPELLELIVVDGSIFHATTNLCEALRHIRKTTEPLTIWIDAVCINQKDNIEKSMQVPLMRTIYAEAEKVLVWLGEDGEDWQTALRLIRTTKRTTWEEVQENNDKRQLLGFLVLTDDHQLGDFWKFINRPWWSRVWVVQEVVVSRNVALLCGTETLPWGDFLDAFKIWRGILEHDIICSERPILDEAADCFRTMIRSWTFSKIAELSIVCRQYNGTETWPLGLLDLLAKDDHFKSSDPRDKVYAWMGLAKEDDITFPCDYDEPVVHVYARVVHALLEKDNSLFLLSRAGTGENPNRPKLDSKPSWVPDLRNWPPGPGLLYAVNPDGSIQVNFLKKDPAVASISLESMTLHAQGFRLGQIDFVSARKAGTVTPQEGRAKLCHWMNFVSAHKDRLYLQKGVRSINLCELLNVLTDGNSRVSQEDLGEFLAVIGLAFVTHEAMGESSSSNINPMARFAVPQEILSVLRAGVGVNSKEDIVQPPSTLTSSTTPDVAPENPASATQEQNSHDIKTTLRIIGVLKLKTLLEIPLEPLLDADTRGPYENHLFDLLKQMLPIKTMRDTEGEGTRTIPLVRHWYGVATGFFNFFKYLSCGNFLFTTDNGLLGMCFNIALVGDQVCRLQGCFIPLVVRQHREYFELIGQCCFPQTPMIFPPLEELGSETFEFR